MNRTAVLAASLLLVPALLPGASALLDNPVSVTGAGWAGTEAAPGDVGRTLSVDLQDMDSATYSSVSATLSDTAAVHPAPGGETATLSGDFTPGSVWNPHFTVNVDSTASPTGAVQIPLALTMAPKGTTAVRTYALTINARLTGHAALTITSSAITLPASAHATLPLVVNDTGSGAAGGVTLTITPAAGSSLAVSGRDNVFSVGGLAPGQAATLAVPVLTPSQPGPETLNLALAYSNAAGAAVQEMHQLTVRVAEPLPGPLQVSLVSARLAQNQTGSVVVRVTNGGDAVASNVAGAYRLPGGSPAPFSVLSASDTTSFGDLAPHQSRTAELDVLVAAGAADPQPVAFSVSWYDDAGAFHQQAYNFTVRVAAQSPGAPSGLTATLDRNRLGAGREDALRFTLTNGGAGALLQPSVTFKLPASGLITPINASDAQTLDDLGAGNGTVVTLDLLTAKSASDVYPISMVVSWNDESGGAHAQTFNYGVAVVGTVDVQLTGLSGSTSTSAVTLAGTLTNLGNAVAHNAYLSVGFGGGFLPTDPVYLGDLDPNTALPFTLPTTLLNATNATGGNGTGGFGQRGQGSGGVPVNRTGGGFGGRGGGFGGRGGNNATLTLTWNDDYGTIHSLTYEQPVALRAGGTGRSQAATTTTSKVPALGLGIVLVSVAGLALARRKAR
ncbi:MAG: hypothetical protein QOE90_3069 [Thermoplasmata archaeon]|jgi:hypothetical protein|nr:hypothetical protein [Thermoplasmata archaeon]